MATLPRYQNLGVQYADLPKISTAAQDAQARGFDNLSRSLDRMTSYFQSQAETEAKKQGKKYAVENPLTTSQLDAALKNPASLKIEGAGTIFQDTYQAYAATQLSADLQLQAGSEFKSIELDFESGKISSAAASEKMRDLMDGQSAVMNAISPDAAVQHRSAVATLAKTSYNKVLDQQQKADFALEGAKLDLALQNLPQQLEDVIRYNASSIDPETQKPVDVQKLIAIQLQPFAESIRKFGGDKAYFEKALKMVDDAKVGALTSLMQDRKFSPNPIDALKRIQKGDYGNLTPIYNSLDQTSKDKVRTSVIKSLSDEQTLFDINEKAVKAENQIKTTALELEIIRPGISATRLREAVYSLVAMNSMTLEQADKHLNGGEGKGDVNLYLQLNDQINRGVLSSLGNLSMYKNSLSAAEYKTLGVSMTSTQGRMAEKMIFLEAGIEENSFISEDQSAKKKALLGLYQEELDKTTVNSSGVGVFVTPTDAAEKAIDRYNKTKKDEKKATAIQKAEEQIANVLKESKVSMPKLPIQSMDFSTIPGLKPDVAASLRKIRDDAFKGR